LKHFMNNVPEHDGDLGILVYFTEGEGIGGRIKSEPDDFIVKEIPLLPSPKEDGQYLICSVQARNWETNHLVREIGRRLGISRRKIGFAGTKDKRGVTLQYMSFDGVSAEEINSLGLKDVEIIPIQRSRRPLSIGDLWGNEFRITVRDCIFSGERLLQQARSIISQLEAMGGFPNFFGVQRFGSLRPNTHLIGEAIIRRDFRRAVHLYAGNPSSLESEATRNARELFDGGADAGAVLSSMPSVMSFERTLVQHLQKHPEDYVGALRRLPPNLLMMFVHALQAKLFNEMLSIRIMQHLPINLSVVGDIVLPRNEEGLPDRERYINVSESNINAVNEQLARGNGFVSCLLFGYESVFASGQQGEIEKEIVASHALSAQDFIVPEIKECTSSGSRREVLSPLSHVELDVDGDSITLKFRLIRGSYATVFLRELMKC
jgi:tRNA pseudouridine13 synthase